MNTDPEPAAGENHWCPKGPTPRVHHALLEINDPGRTDKERFAMMTAVAQRIEDDLHTLEREAVALRAEVARLKAALADGKEATDG